MSGATDLTDGLAIAQGIRRADEAKAILSAAHVSLSFSSIEDGDALVAGTNQTHFLVPNGGWFKMANFFAGGDGWAEGDAEVTVYALRDEEEVELATATLTAEGPQVTLLEQVQLLAGDQIHVEVAWGDVGEAEVALTANLSFGLFR